MFKVNKGDEPQFFSDFKRTHNLKSWKEYEKYVEIKRKLREHTLLEEQYLCCPYCEIELDIDGSETEHIKPKDKFPSEFQNYFNLITTCKSPNRCGNKKGNQWSEKFINPVEENPMNYFTYDIKTGEIKPKFKSGIEYEKAIETINLLNLNEKGLKGRRKNFILENSYNLDYLEIDGVFRTLREFLIENKEIFS